MPVLAACGGSGSGRAEAALPSYLAPVVAPASLVAPGFAHWLRGDEQTARALSEGGEAGWRGFFGAALPGAADVASILHSYDQFDLAGIPTDISGGGGAIPEQFDAIGGHYLRVTVDPAAQTFDVKMREVD